MLVGITIFGCQRQPTEQEIAQTMLELANAYEDSILNEIGKDYRNVKYTKTLHMKSEPLVVLGDTSRNQKLSEESKDFQMAFSDNIYEMVASTTDKPWHTHSPYPIYKSMDKATKLDKIIRSHGLTPVVYRMYFIYQIDMNGMNNQGAVLKEGANVKDMFFMDYDIRTKSKKAIVPLIAE